MDLGTDDTGTGDGLGVESPEATKEKRIAARRKRVMAKIEAAQRAAQGKEPSSVCQYSIKNILSPTNSTSFLE